MISKGRQVGAVGSGHRKERRQLPAPGGSEAWPSFRDARPNAAHAAAVELERAGKLEMVVTQNIDGLHAAAERGVPYVVVNRGATEHDHHAALTLGLEGDVIFPEAVESALRD